METKCQHLTMTKRNYLLKLSQIFEDMFDGTIGTWKTDTVDFELKEDAKKNAREHTQYQRYTRKCFKRRLNV